MVIVAGLKCVSGYRKGRRQHRKPLIRGSAYRAGISILGTSGIVEPMSEKALISSIEVEMKQKASGGKQYLLVAPGNYGLNYLSGHFPFAADEAVKCSNYVGQTIDFAVNMGLERHFIRGRISENLSK